MIHLIYKSSSCSLHAGPVYGASADDIDSEARGKFLSRTSELVYAINLSFGRSHLSDDVRLTYHAV